MFCPNGLKCSCRRTSVSGQVRMPISHERSESSLGSEWLLRCVSLTMKSGDRSRNRRIIGMATCGTLNPIRTRPACPSLTSSTLDRTLSKCWMACRDRLKIRKPGSVSFSGLRQWKIRTPSRSSIRAIRSDTPGRLMPAGTAASEKLPVSATATRVRRSEISNHASAAPGSFVGGIVVVFAMPPSSAIRFGRSQFAALLETR